MTGLLDLDQDAVGVLFSVLQDRKSKESFVLSTRAIGHAPSVIAQMTTMKLDLPSVHSCSDDCNPLLRFRGLHLKRLIVGDIFRFDASSDDDGDALVQLLQPQGPLGSQVQQRLQSLEMLWIAGFRIKSADIARATGKAMKSLPQLHTLRVDGTSLHPAFYEALASEPPESSSAGSSTGAESTPESSQATQEPTVAIQPASNRDEELDVPGLRKLNYGFMNDDEPPLRAISAISSLHSLEFTIHMMDMRRRKVRPLRALKQLRHLAANKDSMPIFEGLDAAFSHLPKLESLEVSNLKPEQLWELPMSLTRLSFGFQFTEDLCTQLETLALMADPVRDCPHVRHLHISILCYDGPDDEAGARQLGQRIAGLLQALPHLTLEVRLLCDVYGLPPILAFLSELPAAKSIKEIAGDARFGAPCCADDQKQEFDVPQLMQLATLCPGLTSLELAGPRYKENKMQNCTGVIAEHFTNLEKLELHVNQMGSAEAVLAFCTECALKRPSRNFNPLVVNLLVDTSSMKHEDAEYLEGLEDAWHTRAANLHSKQREVELHVHCTERLS